MTPSQEVAAARSIAQRGVMLVASTHGPSLKALLRNHTLAPLLGGIEVGARARHGAVALSSRPAGSALSGVHRC